MLHPILADAFLPGDTLSWVAGVVGVAAGLGFLWLLFTFLSLYVRCLLTGAGVGLFDLARMKWCHVDYEVIVKEKIKLTLAGLPDVRAQDLEAHALARGNVTKVVDAVVAAHKAGIALTWDESAPASRRASSTAPTRGRAAGASPPCARTACRCGCGPG